MSLVTYSRACLSSTFSTYFCDTRCGSSAALQEPVSPLTLTWACDAEGSDMRASSCPV